MSLSAWCGTAARLMVASGDAAETADGTRFLSFDHISADPRVHVEALDAREAWPPLLRPGVLAGFDAYTAWERRVLAHFLEPARAGTAPLSEMLARALGWTDVLRGWTPSAGSLDALMHRPWRPPAAHTWLRNVTASETLRARVLEPLLMAVPAEWRPLAWPGGLTDASTAGAALTRAHADAALARYLATRLMGSWVAYQGSGLRSVAASLVHAYVLASLALWSTEGDDGAPVTVGRLTSAIRAADWLLLHLLDRDVWADACSAHESDADAAPLIADVAAATRLLDECHWPPHGT